MKVDEVAGYCANHYSAFEFLSSRCIIRREAPRCSKCEGLMSLVRTGCGDMRMWRCRIHKSEKKSERADSILMSKKISLQDFIMLVYLWTHEIRLTTTAEMVGLSDKTVVNWYAAFQTVCSDHFTNNPVKIGGTDHLVQIDEFASLLPPRKRKKDDDDEDYCVSVKQERWVFAGLDTTTNLGFVVFVPDKTSSNLLSLIETFILPGSTIHSYKRDVYNNDKIGKIPVEPPYIHEAVNQINAVKCMWGNCKTKLIGMQGVHSTRLPSHLDEFMWRQRYGRTHSDAFDNMLLHISQLHVTP